MLAWSSFTFKERKQLNYQGHFKKRSIEPPYFKAVATDFEDNLQKSKYFLNCVCHRTVCLAPQGDSSGKNGIHLIYIVQPIPPSPGLHLPLTSWMISQGVISWLWQGKLRIMLRYPLLKRAELESSKWLTSMTLLLEIVQCICQGPDFSTI